MECCIARPDPQPLSLIVLTLMLPYSIAFAIGWTVLLALWILFGIPLGPGSGMFYPPARAHDLRAVVPSIFLDFFAPRIHCLIPSEAAKKSSECFETLSMNGKSSMISNLLRSSLR
jgi:hypothetical protein